MHNSDEREEVKCWISSAYRAFLFLVPLLKIKNASQEVRVIIYKTLIHPVFLYVSETWMLSQSATQMIGLLWRKNALENIWNIAS